MIYYRATKQTRRFDLVTIHLKILTSPNTTGSRSCLRVLCLVADSVIRLSPWYHIIGILSITAHNRQVSYQCNNKDCVKIKYGTYFKIQVNKHLKNLQLQSGKKQWGYVPLPRSIMFKQICNVFNDHKYLAQVHSYNSRVANYLE